MHANKKLVPLYEELAAMVKGEQLQPASVVAVDQWEESYKQLKAIRAFFGESWDKIEKEIRATMFPEEWVWIARSDATFRQYYQLRSKIDKLEVLVR